VYKVVDSNINPYMNIVMDAVGMDQGFVAQRQIVDEEPNACTINFLIL